MKKFFKYCLTCRVLTFVSMILFSLWFLEAYLAIGPGWDMWWMFGWLIVWLLFLCMMIFGKNKSLWWAFLLCNMLQTGGCSWFSRIEGLPEKGEYTSYDRLTMGRYSAWIPIGARNIKFTHSAGFFAGCDVECQISEDDLLKFCWRNGYKVRKGSQQLNERTGKPMTTSWFGYEPKEGEEDYYSYFDVAETCAGVKLLYDIKNETLHLSWSTN